MLSLRYQSLAPNEVIISDDGSQGDVPSAIHGIVREMDCKVKFISQEHKNFRLARCRNNGARVAKGEYLIFMDQDIILPKNYIKTFVKHSKEHQFCVAYPIRLTARQTNLLDNALIKSFNFVPILNQNQIQKVKKQHIKDCFYRMLKRFRLREIGPKLRGGVAAIHFEDYIHVNGYDETYQGWGNEDDDLGRRLYRAGISGKNPFYHEFPLHLYHEPFHWNGKRKNQQYYLRRLKEIKNGNYRCVHGFDNSSGSEKVNNMDLN